MEKSLGERRVRTDFNVSGSTMVDLIKQKSAELINLIEVLKADANIPNSGETIRLVSLAQTAFEDGAMWAVKAATMPA